MIALKRSHFIFFLLVALLVVALLPSESLGQGAPAFSLSLSPSSVQESSGSTSVNVSVIAADNVFFEISPTFNVSILDGDAVAGEDFDAVSDFSFYIAADVFSRGSVVGWETFNLTVTDDSLIETDENFTVAGSISGFDVVPANFTIIDDASDNAIRYSVSGPDSDAELAEGDVLTVNISGSAAPGTGGSILCTISPDNSSGRTGAGEDDFGSLTALAAFSSSGPGSVTSGCVFNVTDDDDYEGVENFNVSFSAPESGSIAGAVYPPPRSFRIGASDIIVGFESSSYYMDESDGTVAVYVAVTQPSSQSVSFDNPFSLSASTRDGSALAGSDYTSISGQTLGPFRNGGNRTSFLVHVRDDNEAEGAEDIHLDLNFLSDALPSVSISPNAATVIIEPSDPLSNDSMLSGINLSSGSLSPRFSSGRSSYTVLVENSVSSVTVTPLSSDNRSILDIEPPDADSVAGGHQVSLAAGAESAATVSVNVTAQDGSSSQYALLIIRNGTTKYDLDGDGLIDVSTLEQLNAIRWDPNGTSTPAPENRVRYYSVFSNAEMGMGCPDPGCRGYELANDLDFDTGASGNRSDDEYWNGGLGWLPIGSSGEAAYSGVFKGNGRVISNLYVDRPNGISLGLFGRLGSGGSIEGLGLHDANVSGRRQAGSLAGRSEGNVTASYATGSVEALQEAGGLVGRNDGFIGASYARVSVSGESGIGGLVGSQEDAGAEINASYSMGMVSGNGSNIGGLVGNDSGSVRDSYWDVWVSGQTGSAGKTTKELQSPGGYAGIYRNWNLSLDGNETSGGNDPWDFGNSSQYPALKYGDHDPDGQARDAPEFTPAFNASVESQTYSKDHEIAPLVLPEASGGNGPLKYNLTPDLPVGLVFDSSTRTISGTPTELKQSTTYVWKAADSDSNEADSDAATLNFTILVTDQLAMLSDVSLSSDNQRNSSFAKLGDNLTLSFTSSVELNVAGTAVVIAGSSAGLSRVAEATGFEYSASATVRRGMPEGAARFSIAARSSGGILSQTYAGPSDPDDLVIIDVSPPVIGLAESAVGRYLQTSKIPAARDRRYLNRGDRFGSSVAVSDSHVAVGAPYDDDGNGANSGAVYVFERSLNGRMLKISENGGGRAGVNVDLNPNDMFGTSVALAGNILAVGSASDNDGNGANSGAVYVFEKSGGSWRQTLKISESRGRGSLHVSLDPNDEFGRSVALSEAGTVLVVGAPGDDDDGNGSNSGAAYVFEKSGSSWEQTLKLSAVGSDPDGLNVSLNADDRFGFSVGVSGDSLVVGAPYNDESGNESSDADSGAAYVFERSGGSWEQTLKISGSSGSDRLSVDLGANETFGVSVSLSGTSLAVGSEADGRTGKVRVFRKTSGSWDETMELSGSSLPEGIGPNDRFGSSVALYGDAMAAGARGTDGRMGRDSGAVYLFTQFPTEVRVFAVDDESSSFWSVATVSGTACSERQFSDGAGSDYAEGSALSTTRGERWCFRSIDAAGNRAYKLSTVSVDATPPDTPVIFFRSKPFPDHHPFPTFTVSNLEPGATAQLYTARDCSDASAIGPPAVAGPGENSVNLTTGEIRLGQYIIYVKQTDLANNPSACSSGVGINFQRVDYDSDGDGLIDVYNLRQLNGIRHDLDGDGRPDNSSQSSEYSAAFPYSQTGMGCPLAGCRGYELMNDLDFDTGEAGYREDDAYWNNGMGWRPIGVYTTPFNAIFRGKRPYHFQSFTSCKRLGIIIILFIITASITLACSAASAEAAGLKASGLLILS